MINFILFLNFVSIHDATDDNKICCKSKPYKIKNIITMETYKKYLILFIHVLLVKSLLQPDMIKTTLKDPLQVSCGSITRSKANKLKNAFNEFI